MEELTKKVEKAIEEAIRLELRGRDFFSHAAGLTHNELGKKMFQRLADEEMNHLKTFSELISSVLGDTDWRQYVQKAELAKDSSLIEELAARMKKAEGKSEIEALTIGLELEMKAMELFQRAAQETDDPKASQIFSKIYEEEKFHYDLLQAQLDSLTHSGFWLDSAEFQMDGKW